MHAYSNDLRLRVLHAHLNGESSQREIACRFDVSRSFVQKLIRQYQQTGSVDARPTRGGARRKVGRNGRPVLKDIVAEKPTATLSELCSEYESQTGIEVSVSTMHRAVKALST